MSICMSRKNNIYLTNKPKIRYCKIIPIILLPLILNITNAEDCKNGELYHAEFGRCCEKTTCRQGSYYNCTACIPCPNGTYNPEEDTTLTHCPPFTSCNEDQIVISPGSSTHDRVCGYPQDGSTLTTGMPSTETTLSLTNSMAENVTTAMPLQTPVVILIVIVIIAMVVLAILAVYHFWWKRIRIRSRRAQSNDSGENIPMNNGNVQNHQDPRINNPLLSNGDFLEDEFDIAKRNIKRDISRLRKDMISDKGIFWAALKEGNNGFTYDEQETCLRSQSSNERNGIILDKANTNAGKVKSLVYALLVSGQEHLANLISKSVTEDLEQNYKRGDRVTKPWNPDGDDMQKLRNNRVYILENLTVDAEFWSHLRQNDIFSQEDEDMYRGLLTDNARKDYIIELLLKGSRKIESFKSALKETNNDSLLNLFDPV